MSVYRVPNTFVPTPETVYQPHDAEIEGMAALEALVECIRPVDEAEPLPDWPDVRAAIRDAGSDEAANKTWQFADCEQLPPFPVFGRALRHVDLPLLTQIYARAIATGTMTASSDEELLTWHTLAFQGSSDMLLAALSENTHFRREPTLDQVDLLVEQAVAACTTFGTKPYDMALSWAKHMCVSFRGMYQGLYVAPHTRELAVKLNKVGILRAYIEKIFSIDAEYIVKSMYIIALTTKSLDVLEYLANSYRITRDFLLEWHKDKITMDMFEMHCKIQRGVAAKKVIRLNMYAVLTAEKEPNVHRIRTLLLSTNDLDLHVYQWIHTDIYTPLIVRVLQHCKDPCSLSRSFIRQFPQHVHLVRGAIPNMFELVAWEMFDNYSEIQHRFLDSLYIHGHRDIIFDRIRAFSGIRVSKPERENTDIALAYLVSLPTWPNADVQSLLDGRKQTPVTSGRRLLDFMEHLSRVQRQKVCSVFAKLFPCTEWQLVINELELRDESRS